MTDYTPALGQVLSTGLRYMDNQQRIEANERQSREQRQHEAYQFDKRYELESHRLSEQIKYQYKALAEDAAIKHKHADAVIIDAQGRADMNRGMGALHAARAGSVAEATRQSKDTYDSKKQAALLKKRNAIYAKTMGELDAGYARYKIGEVEAGREPLSREDFLSKDPYSRNVLKTLVGNDPMKKAAIESSHNMTLGEEALAEVPGHEGKFVVPGTSTINGQPTLATTGNEVVADNPQAMPVVEDMMTVLAQADINANAAGYRGLASTANALAISSLTGGMSLEELSKPDVAHAIIKEVPGAIEVEPSEQATAAEQTGFRQLAGWTGGGGFHIPTGPSTTTSITSPPVQRVKPTGGNRAVEGLRHPDRVLRAQREAGIHAVSQFSTNPEAVLEAVQGRGVTTAEAKHNRALEAKDAEMERGLTAEAIRANRAEARAERKFNRENPHAGFRQQAEREQLERRQKNATARRGISDGLMALNFDDKGFWLDANAESYKERPTQEENQKVAINDIIFTSKKYRAKLQPVIQEVLRQTYPDEKVSMDPDNWTERQWRTATEIILLERAGDEKDWGVGWLFGGHDVSLGELSDRTLDDYRKGERFNDWEK